MAEGLPTVGPDIATSLKEVSDQQGERIQELSDELEKAQKVIEAQRLDISDLTHRLEVVSADRENARADANFHREKLTAVHVEKDEWKARHEALDKGVRKALGDPVD